jgi:hypothetical protein
MFVDSNICPDPVFLQEAESPGFTIDARWIRTVGTMNFDGNEDEYEDLPQI